MAIKDWHLSSEQTDFLAVLALIEQPVSAEMIGEIAPLSIKSFWELVNRKTGNPLISQSKTGHVKLTPDFPVDLKAELRDFITPDRLRVILERFDTLGLAAELRPELLINLHLQAGNEDKSAQFEISLATQAQESGDYKKAIDHFKKTIQVLLGAADTSPENNRILINCVFDLSMLLLVQGLFMAELSDYLLQVVEKTRESGDRRNLAMAYLHRGTWKVYAGDKTAGLDEIRQGKKIVEEIRDDDILAQSLPFREFCVFTQGRYRETLEMYDQTMQKADMLRDIYGNYIAGLHAGAAAAFLGQFHRAVGILDSNWHMARARHIHGLAAALRAFLGQTLVMMGKSEEGLVHCLKATKEAETGDYGLAHYLALGGTALCYMQEGDFEKAGHVVVSNRKKISQTGMKGIIIAPWSYEMFYELKGLLEDDETKHMFLELIEAATEDINIGIKGTAKRLKAMLEMRGSGDRETVYGLLRESEACLKGAEDPIQLAKTRIELARLELSRGNNEESRVLALKARKGLSGLFEQYYPNDLRFLLEGTAETGSQQESVDKMEEMLLSMLETIIPQTDCAQLMKQLLITVNNYLQAKRIGLFWFEDPAGKSPELRSAYNISRVIVNSESFRTNLTYVFESFQKNTPLVFRREKDASQWRVPSTAMIICLPFEVNGQPRGVVYLDYSYSEHITSLVNRPFLKKLSHHIGLCIERILQCDNLLIDIKDTTISSSIEFGHARSVVHPESKNRKMARIYEQAGKMARTDATILLTGETGTGKEFLARWIHQQSLRADKPFIIIDPTTISENLFESELFGHEKGAFTGADRQKPGRIELAHNGTLFIDELGEIPPAIQVKLLRVLQEKTYVRVGGTKTLTSHFRLIVATNRNLEKEVAEGRFREDLYYRINVMAFKLLPLHERQEDIVPLAEFFLRQSAAKYKRRDLQLSPDNKSWLKTNPWPGNIRELAHTIEKAVLISGGPHLDLSGEHDSKSGRDSLFGELVSLDEMQRRYIEFVMRETGGKLSGTGGAADILDMKRTTLQARMKKLGVTTGARS